MSYNEAGKWIEEPTLVDLHKLAHAIARALHADKARGEIWKYDSKRSTWDHDAGGPHLCASAYLVNGNLTLAIERKRDGKSVEVRGSFPTHAKASGWYYTSKEKLDIGCALSKGAEGIASDIARRLLPTMRSEAAKAAEYIAERDAYANDKQAVQDRLHKACGTLRGAHSSETIYLTCMPEDISGTVRVDSPTSCKLELTGLSPDQVIAIVESLRK